MAVPVKLNDPGYKNWLRACLGLQYLKEGIVDFVDAEVKQFHASIISNICNSGTCNQCNINTLTAKRRPQTCPNKICDRLCKEIEREHRFKPCWTNADATKWCTDHWEFGKCFMPPGCATVSKATDTDCTGLLSVCINGMFLPNTVRGQVSIPNNIFHKNRDARNNLLHSGSMSISDAERQDYIDDMIKLLTSYKTPVDQVTQDAIDKLIELNTNNVVILQDSELSMLQQKIDTMTSSLTEVKEQVGTQKTDSDQHKDQVQNSLTEMDKQVKEHSNADLAEIQNNAKSLDTLSQKIVELQSNTEGMVVIQATCTSLQKRIKDLNKQLLEIENRLSDHETKVEYQLGDHATKIANHETRINDFWKHLNDTKTTDINPEQSVKDVQDFLIAKYKRDELHVQMSPLVRPYTAHIDEVYTKLIVRNGLIHNPKGKEEDNRKSQTQKEITTYQEILYDGQLSCKNIYVLGMAGIGKTTWSRKLVATWIKAMENRGDKEWKPNEDETFLQDYELVFYLSLRHARAYWQITQMIRHQLFHEDNDLLAAAKRVLRKPEYSSKCIIILDGLDEWCSPDDDMSTDGLPVQDPTWKCSTITTTKSCTLEALQLERNKIDRAVEIQGLDTSGIDKLTDHIVDALNHNLDKTKIASEFQSQVLPSIRACMQVPLLLSIFVCLWHDDIRINEHLAGMYRELLEMLIRCAEGRKRQLPKLPKEKLNDMKRIWRSENCSYPECLSSKPLLVTYIPFLLRLGKLAFDELLSGNLESMLVFDYDSVEDLKWETELDFAVKIGLLSQTIQRNSACKDTFSLSFLHKTVQEYLAALYMVSGDKQLESLTKFKAHCNSKRVVLEMENVLLFVSGVCPETAGDISCHIADMEPDIRIHQLLLRCWKETRVVSNTAVQIYIKYNFIYGDNSYNYSDDANEDTISYLRQAKCKETSLHLDYTLNRKGSTVQTLDLSGCLTLRKLECKGSNVPLLVPPSLEELIIEEYITGSVDTVLDLSECQKLKTFHYTKSSVPLQVPASICSLEEVEVWGYEGPTGSLLDLSGCQSLRKLRYEGPTGSLLDLSGCQSLRKLRYGGSIVPLRVPPTLHRLEEVRIKGYTGPAEPALDLSGCQLLRILHYRKSTVPLRLSTSLHSLAEVVIMDYTISTEFLLALAECQSLRKLHYTASSPRQQVLCPTELRRISNSDSLDSMSPTVQLRLPASLEEIAIKSYGGHAEWMLDMSRCKSLRKIEYMWSVVPLQLPPSLDSLEEVSIQENTAHTASDSLGEVSIQENTAHTVPDSLGEVSIQENTAHTASVLNLSGYQSLKKLQYGKSAVPLRVPPNLEEITLWEYTVPAESVLDLSGCQSLRKLHCSYSAVPLILPHSLENIELVGYTCGTVSLLDLSGCQSLKTLHYSNSTVPLQVPPSLEEVMIDGYEVSTESMLDLSGCQSLRKLHYTGSTVPLRVPSSLEEILVEGYTDSTGSVLDLTGCLSLNTLNFKNSTVPLQVPPKLKEVILERYEGPVEFVLDLSGCQTLRLLHCTDCSLPLRVPPCLKEVIVERYSGPPDSELDLSGCNSLKTLLYTSSSVPLRVPPSLEELTIEEYTGSAESVLDLSGCHSLRKLQYAGSSVPVLVPTSLQELLVWRYNVSTDAVLDLYGCLSLKNIRYTQSNAPLRLPSSLEDVEIDEYTVSKETELDLSGCGSLRKLIYTRSTVELRVSSNLEEIVIEGYEASTESMLDLSGCQSLRKLHYTGCTAPIRVPTSLEEILIEGYTDSTESELDLSECQCLKTLYYSNSTVPLLVPPSLEELTTDGYTVSTESMLDLSECQTLKTLHYSKSTVPLRIPPSLEEVTIDAYEVSTESMLDLSGCQSLRKLHYTGSTAPIRVPTSLEEVKIRDHTGPAGLVLDLTECLSLKYLVYKSSSAPLWIHTKKLISVQTDRQTADLIHKQCEASLGDI